jgi:hypothetical protein
MYRFPAEVTNALEVIEPPMSEAVVAEVIVALLVSAVAAFREIVPLPEVVIAPSTAIVVVSLVAFTDTEDLIVEVTDTEDPLSEILPAVDS